MINLSTKFKTSISTGYKDVKGDTKCGKWAFLGYSRVTQRLLEIAPFDTVYTGFD